MNREDLLVELVKYLDEPDTYGDVESFFEDKNIGIVEIDTYVSDADDKGYSQHVVYEVLTDEPFKFIYEWYGGRWQDFPSIYLATPVQVTRYEPAGDNIRDKYYEEIYE